MLQGIKEVLCFMTWKCLAGDKIDLKKQAFKTLYKCFRLLETKISSTIVVFFRVNSLPIFQHPIDFYSNKLNYH